MIVRSENYTQSVTKIARAYVACEMGHHDTAMHLLLEAATFAWLDGDISKHAACIKARAALATLTGKCHLSVIGG